MAASDRGPESLIGMFAARVGLGTTLGDLLNRRGLDRAGALDVGSFEIAKSLALQGLGVAVLPHRVATLGNTGRKLVRVPGLPRRFGEHGVSLVRAAGDDRGAVAIVSAEMLGVE